MFAASWSVCHQNTQTSTRVYYLNIAAHESMCGSGIHRVKKCMKQHFTPKSTIMIVDYFFIFPVKYIDLRKFVILTCLCLGDLKQVNENANVYNKIWISGFV